MDKVGRVWVWVDGELGTIERPTPSTPLDDMNYYETEAAALAANMESEDD